VSVDVQIKAENGEASLLNYLRVAQRVAPLILPDIIVINTQQLWQIVDLGLIEAIELGEIGQAGDFYQFALDAVTYNGQTYGIPYTADLLHLAYHQNQLTTAPTTWEE
jgi:arabinogalactan oligomer/maltooligosaccharide transport system substrate-binding protein